MFRLSPYYYWSAIVAEGAHLELDFATVG